ncbi:hypothetical protein KQI11_06585 [Acetanaerobacterium sp. MSJ-12]|uniref:hypothetical protein n=1 Tax=Acetanaerobacterium sp. MSJ-12 TaxID=2841535 RepID=UPI001C0EC13E|nr:hypothetical protein [Acetanaerobacterium sp. MSJ-12]MBU5419788.1 hypothetical protein [Acetanaerobacterium sp. MSJ-12]
MERQEKRTEWKDMLKTLAAVVPVAITLAGGLSFFHSFGRASYYGLENSLSHFSFLLGDRFVFWGTLGAFALGFVVFWVVRACLHAFCRQVQSQYNERRQWTVRLYRLFFGKKKKVVRTLLAFVLVFLFSFAAYLFPFGVFSEIAGLGWSAKTALSFASLPSVVAGYCWLIYQEMDATVNRRLLIPLAVLVVAMFAGVLCIFEYGRGLEEASEQKTYLILYDREAEETTGEEQCYAVAYVDDLYYAFSCRREGEGRLVIETARPRNFERTHPHCERVTFGEVAVME